MIHVFIEKGKDFVVPENSDIDPMFHVEALGKKQFSQAKKGIGAATEVVWDEHIFLECVNIDKKEAENGKITIKLMDKGIFKDAMIGRFDFDLNDIYLKDNHTLLHKWVALNNPEAEDYAEIKGQVKVSI